MRSFFGVLEMENYQGDLTDIVRAGGRRLAQPEAPAAVSSSWDYFPADTINNNNLSPSIEDNNYNNDRDDSIFGDPFCNVRDPLLHELNVAATAAGGSSYFSSSTNSADFLSTTSAEDIRNFRSANSTITTTTTSSVVLDHHHHHKVFEDGMSTSPCNIFSRIQISLNNNPTKLPVSSSPPAEMAQRGHKPSAAVVSSDMLSSNISKGCLIENSGQVQISSPRNLGIKRRKSQAKKVVCIPAPAAASSRSSGELVPSDLWAWRKYGQKPIKGSPYPRGYYRCSSSKGCSARKQVERSRTDPNMLVITYTSEHNHPWPTQRNALAGSTRSQPPKNNIAGGAKSSPASQVQQKSTRTNTKEEQKESSNDTLSPTIAAAAAAVTSCSTAVKEEEIEDTEKQMEMDENEYSEGLHQSYRPALPESSQSEDFFADLGEIGADPLDLLFTQGFSAQDQEQKGSKALDPFSIFDWSASGDNSSSFGEAKEGL